MVILLFPNSSVNHFFVLFLLLFITALIDVAAYLVGSSIGKTPLFQDLSPNKTLEGFIGSVIITTLFLSHNLLVRAHLMEFIFTVNSSHSFRFYRRLL